MKLLATETETCVIDRATLIAPTKVSLPCSPIHPTQTWKFHGAIPTCSQGGPNDPTPLEEKQIHGPTHRFQEGDATDGTSCAPSGPCRSTRQFPSSETQHGTIKSGAETAPM